MWHGSLFEQLLNTQRSGLPFLTHTNQKQKQKEQLKFKTPKTILKKPKEGKKKTSKKKKR